MSQLEGRTAPLVARLLPGIDGRKLSGEEAGLLALWAFKTAIVLNAASNYRRIVPEGHFSYLYSKHQIPQQVVVDVAHLQGNQRVTSAQSQHFVGIVQGDTQKALHLIRESAYNIVLGVGPIAFRVAHLPVPEHRTVADLEQPNRTKRLWPGPKAIVLSEEHGFGDLQEFAMALTFEHEA